MCVLKYSFFKIFVYAVWTVHCPNNFCWLVLPSAVMNTHCNMGVLYMWEQLTWLYKAQLKPRMRPSISTNLKKRLYDCGAGAKWIEKGFFFFWWVCSLGIKVLCLFVCFLIVKVLKLRSRYITSILFLCFAELEYKSSSLLLCCSIQYSEQRVADVVL